MNKRASIVPIIALLGFAMLGAFTTCHATDMSLPGIDIQVDDDKTEGVATAIKVILMLTVLSLAPALLIVMTSFTRIVIVLSMLRHAFGMQQTPPNTVLVSLALFLTLFSMAPVFKQINEQAYVPLMEDELTIKDAVVTGMKPLRKFMISQTNESDLALLIDLSKSQRPERVNDIDSIQLIPAFMLSELKTSFQIGFIIFLPFLLIDIVVSSILMSMGMLMVPPMMISLPVKILMFVLIDGWNLVVRSLMGSFF